MFVSPMKKSESNPWLKMTNSTNSSSGKNNPLTTWELSGNPFSLTPNENLNDNSMAEIQSEKDGTDSLSESEDKKHKNILDGL